MTDGRVFVREIERDGERIQQRASTRVPAAATRMLGQGWTELPSDDAPEPVRREVKQGDVIGRVGTADNPTGAHVQLETTRRVRPSDGKPKAQPEAATEKPKAESE